MMASLRLFKPQRRGDCVDCVNSPLAMRSSRVLARAGVAITRRVAVTRARALSARAEEPPVANPAPRDVARVFATAWMRAFLLTRAGAAEATGAASDIMAAPVLTSRKHSRGDSVRHWGSMRRLFAEKCTARMMSRFRRIAESSECGVGQSAVSQSACARRPVEARAATA